MTELYASAMMVGGTLGMVIVAVFVGRPIATGARSKLEATRHE